MGEARKTQDGILLLSVGLVAGFLSAASGFFIWYHNSEVARSVQQPTIAETTAVASQEQSTISQPVANATALTTAQPGIEGSQTGLAATVAAAQTTPGMTELSPLQIAAKTASGEIQVMPEGVALQTYNNPGGIEGTSGSVTASPYWTIGSNGLIGNPPVDPPSSHGRAYSY
ncbi:MAG TPA: hypothetical protein V6C81_10515 [Planktothrix sp.]|jgi:hypothetical protein